jgi:cytochrome c-type biogenesis protein CcmH
MPPAAPAIAASAADPAIEIRARELERRLLAPCCWRETLDVHTSPLSTQLRSELRARLAAGESAPQIEDALVARYGPRLRAQLPDSLGIWLAVAIGLGGAAILCAFGRRRREPVGPSPPPSGAPPARDADYEWQLDQDLRHD